MSNMIGKLSGTDWSKSSEGATHVGLGSSCRMFYKKINDNEWEYSNPWETKWKKSDPKLRADLKLYSKEEDLGIMTKEVKSIEDLEAGMFVKTSDGVIRIVLKTTNRGFKTCVFSSNVSNEYVVNDWDSCSFTKIVNFWSYTHNGEYKSVVVETPEQLKIKELEETIANASKQLQELKGMQK